jgi:hypothetical protein
VGGRRVEEALLHHRRTLVADDVHRGRSKHARRRDGQNLVLARDLHAQRLPTADQHGHLAGEAGSREHQRSSARHGPRGRLHRGQHQCVGVQVRLVQTAGQAGVTGKDDFDIDQTRLVRRRANLEPLGIDERDGRGVQGGPADQNLHGLVEARPGQRHDLAADRRALVRADGLQRERLWRDILDGIHGRRVFSDIGRDQVLTGQGIRSRISRLSIRRDGVGCTRVGGRI